ncbi:MAG: hypothetical protein RQ856_06810 [Candidatus Izemoplasmatales bacterium]|nr:hypothetical protein [Candidatus Izemoplasmatales bacterium]
MLDYIIKKDDNRLYIAQGNNYITKDETISKYLNKILLNRLSNLSALEKTSKRLFGFKNKIPLYIDQDTLLLSIISHRMENSIYINYFSIAKYEKIKDGIIIYFHSYHCFKCKLPYAFISQMKRAKHMVDSLRFISFQLQ